MTEWQPIETAPQSGPFLATGMDEDGEWYPTVVFFDRDFPEQEGRLLTYPSGPGVGWPLTHWMPLPSPPSHTNR